MSLAPGTALQNGHYVVDALLEAAPNGDLYWGTHVVSGMQVFIQVFPVSVGSGSPDLSALMARLEGIAFAPQSPLPNPFQLFLGDEHTLCLAMSTAVGLPWSSARNIRPPMAPKAALAAIRQVANSVTWLKKHGITAVDLSPNRVWLSEESDRITLTGLPQTHLNLATEEDVGPDTSVQFLSRLLYSFLMGELVTDETPEALTAALNRKLPNLSPVIRQAICQGLHSTEVATGRMTLQQWLNQLPDAAAPSDLDQRGGALTYRHSQDAAQPSSSSKLYSALGMTALVAAIAGLSFGTFWRLHAKSLPGAIQFEPDQSFPPQAEWSGDRPDVSFDTPFVPAQTDSIRREDWSDAELEPVPPQDDWGVPATAAEWPNETIEAEEPWDSADELAEPQMTDIVDNPGNAAENSERDGARTPWAETDDTAPQDTSADEPQDNRPQIDNLLRDLPDPPVDSTLFDNSADFSDKKS